MKKVKLQTQIIHFVNGYKRTIKNVVCVWENEMTHILTKEGTEWIINKEKVLAVEIPHNFKPQDLEIFLDEQNKKKA